MADYKRVVEGLKHCEAFGCIGCPYNPEGRGVDGCDMIKDAIELLEKEEPVKPKKVGAFHTWWYVCGACGTDINPHDKYCHEHGKAVDWT